MPRGKPCSLVQHDDVASLISDGLQVPQCSLRTGCGHDWQGLKASLWSPQTKPCWLQGLIPDRLCLPLLPSHFSTASTAAQIQLLITLYVLPVVPLKHNIKSLGGPQEAASSCHHWQTSKAANSQDPKNTVLGARQAPGQKAAKLGFYGEHWVLESDSADQWQQLQHEASEVACPHLPC